jgi:hypothetical protein
VGKKTKLINDETTVNLAKNSIVVDDLDAYS